MVRYIVAAVLGCLYVAGSVLIVRNEGESYRDALRLGKSAAGPPLKPDTKEAAVTGSGQPAEGRTAAPSTAPGAVAQPVLADRGAARAAPGPEHEQAALKRRPESSDRPSSPAVKHARTKSTPRPAHSANEPAAKAPAAAEMVAKVEAFWDQPYLKKAWDIDAVGRDAQMEMDLGRELHDVIVQLNPTVEDSLLRRVEETAEPLIKTVTRKDIRYTFTVLDSLTVNAFSHPGGFIYVSRGLFNMVGEDEDYALEFVLGHEIAHVDLKHALKCLQDSGVKKIPWGTLQKLYCLIIPAAFLDDQEYEADKWVFGRMRTLGRTNRECLAFLNKLDGYAKIHGFENGRAKPSPDSSFVDNHLPAHTAAYKRLKRLKELRDQVSTPRK
ncbi:MAG: M48 family metalloprotease [Isosphaeraceae bacterium]